jgi:hypothetical protein
LRRRGGLIVPAEEPNYLAHAFKSQYNLIGLATAAGFALVSGTALPLLVAAGVEMVVLPLVTWSSRFQRLVRARVAEEENAARDAKRHLEASEMLQAMPELERGRYRNLQSQAGEIRQNYKGLNSTSQMLVEQLADKLDFLLAFYLRMRFSLSRYQAYFNSTDPERISERIAMLDHEMTAGPARIQQVKARTRSVLVKRLDRYHKALENRQLIEAQTETVQEVLQLLRDQSYSMRDPRSISEQLDGLVSSAEETERGVQDMESLLSLEQDMLGGLTDSDPDSALDAELAAGRREAAQAIPAPAPTGREKRGAPVRPVSPPPPPPPRRKLTH